jgi:hypothetical protein
VRVTFVTGSAGAGAGGVGVGVGNLQHRGALRKSNGGSRNVLSTSSTRSVKVIAATIWRNLVCSQLKTQHNRPRTSGFLRCRSEKTSTFTGTHGRREHLKRRAGRVRSDMSSMESGQLLRNALSRAPQSNRIHKQK